MGINLATAFGSLPPPRTLFVNNNAGQQQILGTNGGLLEFSLRPASWMMVPAGNYLIQAGQYSNLQCWDQQAYVWRMLTGYDQVPYMLSSDGTNIRIANTTGGIVGAVVTNAGSGFVQGFYGYNALGQAVSIIGGATTLGNTYLNATPSAGGGTFNTFVGGGVSTIQTPTTTTGNVNSYAGTGYTQAPIVVITPPSNQGAQPFIPASATAVITAGGQVGAITVVNSGAGYVSPPTVTFVNAQGDLTGGGAFVASNVTAITMTSATAVQAMTVASPGLNTIANTGLSSLPTIAFTGSATIGALTAAAVPNLSIRAVATIATAGVAYGASAPVAYSVVGGGYAGAVAVLVNPATEVALISPPLPANVVGASAAGGTITTLPTVLYGGYGYSSVPTLNAYPTGAAALAGVTLATFTLTMGGNTDTIFLYPI